MLHAEGTAPAGEIAEEAPDDLHHKTDPDWILCRMPQHQEKAGIGDRSAAITHSAHTILVDELNAQIGTAESIDVIVSFIKQSGLSPLLERMAISAAAGS